MYLPSTLLLSLFTNFVQKVKILIDKLRIRIIILIIIIMLQFYFVYQELLDVNTIILLAENTRPNNTPANITTTQIPTNTSTEVQDNIQNNTISVATIHSVVTITKEIVIIHTQTLTKLITINNSPEPQMIITIVMAIAIGAVVVGYYTGYKSSKKQESETSARVVKKR